MVKALGRGFGDSPPRHVATYIHAHTHTHHDKLIAMSALPFYIAAPITTIALSRAHTSAKATDPPGEYGVSKSMECDNFPFSALTLLVG